MDDTFTIAACTLPTVDQPFRAGEFDTLARVAFRSAELLDPTTLRVNLVPQHGVAARVADLMVRETACCRFFSFTLIARADDLTLEVSVPAEHRNVLEAIARQLAIAVQP